MRNTNARMVKRNNKDLSVVDDESVQLLEFKNTLRSKLNEILTLWMKDRDGEAIYENFRCWLKLSQAEITIGLKANEHNEDMLENPRLTYIALLRELTMIMQKSTGLNKVLITDRCIDCHDFIQVIIAEYMESSSKLEKVEDSSNVKIDERWFSEDKNNNVTIEKKENGNTNSARKTYRPEKVKGDKQGIVAINILNIGGEEENKYMESIPDDIKQVFREIGFAKWSKEWIPVLVLSPYDVDLALCEMWKQKYDNFKNKNSLMEHIVYWYGTNNPQDFYGFVKKFMTYEDGKKKGYDKLALRLKLNLANGKKLTGAEQTIILAFEELQAALMISKPDRWDRQCLALKDKSNHLYDAKDYLEEEVVRLKRNDVRMENQKIADNLDVEAEYSEEEYASDVASYEYMEPKLKLRNDEILLKQIQNVKQSKITKGEEQPSVKHSTMIVKEAFFENKVNILSSIEERNEEQSVENYIAIEEEEFHQNETVIQPLMDKLNFAITKNNDELAYRKLCEIMNILPTISPSFIELNGVGKLLTNTRRTFDGDENIKNKVKVISRSMKEIYIQKVGRCPMNFKRTWGSKLEENFILEEPVKMNNAFIASSTPSKVIVKNLISAEAVTLDKLCAIANMDHRKHGIATETQISPTNASFFHAKKPSSIKPKKGKFSLSAMIEGSKQISVPFIGLPTAVKLTTSSFVASPVLTIHKKKGPPKWVTDTLPSNISDPTVGDEVRSLGKEFIEALDADWPDEVLQKINYASFVYHIEMAVYEWSQKDEIAIAKNSHQVSVKILKYPENYWMKLRDIVCGLSGDRQFNKPKLLQCMLTGEYESAMDLVKLPGLTFYQSMKNIL